MGKIEKHKTCPKCGFSPSFQAGWDFSYHKECFSYTTSSCDWDDKDVKEHLHQICPECKYTFSVQTKDYDELKGNTWSAVAASMPDNSSDKQVAIHNGGMGQINKETQTMMSHKLSQPNTIKSASTVVPIKQGYVPSPVIPTKCRTCPVDAKKAQKILDEASTP